MKTIELLPVVCLCLLSCSGTTSADGNAAKLNVTARVLDEKDDKVLLRCDVQGASSKHEVFWMDLTGKRLPAEELQVTERGGSYDIVLQATAARLHFYYCAAVNKETRHMTGDGTFGFKTSDFAAKYRSHMQPVRIASVAVGALVFIGVVAAVVVLTLKYIKRRNEGSTPEAAAAL